MRVKQVGQRLDAVDFFRIVDPEFVAYGGDELLGGHLRVEHQRHIDVAGHLLQQAAANGRLAGADLAGQLDKPAALAEAVEQVCKRLPVAAAHEQETRIRGDREWPFT